MLFKILENKRIEVTSLVPKGIKRDKKILNPILSLKEKPIIAEVKKASPTLGDINTQADVVNQAQQYEKAGAGAVSVLTDSAFFKGSFEDLKKVSHHIGLPVLCKDFIISEVQIDIAYEMGADIILLIAKALSKEELSHLAKYAKDKGLFVLFEIHSLEEMDKFPTEFADMVGVNSRDLETLKIDKSMGAEILKRIKGDFFKIAESGIDSPQDVINFKKSGADGFLIGSYLMKSGNPQKSIKELYEGLKCL